MSEESQTVSILDVTPAAADKISELIKTRGKPGLAVRVAIRGKLPGGAGYQTEFKFQERAEAAADDIVQQAGDFEFLFTPSVAEKVQGAKIDFDEQRYSAGFNIEYPVSVYPPGVHARHDWEDPLAQQVQAVIDDYINPGVAGHGGWVLLHDVKDKDVYVEMGGGCQGCGLSAVTLRQGIETAIKDAVPAVGNVVDITEHELGENPYYAAETSGESPFNK